MHYREASRLLRWSVAVAILSGGATFAQKGAASSGASSNVGKPSPTPTTTPTPIPTTQTPTGASAPIFISGQVQMDDGSPVSTNTRIERVCGSTVRLETHTDGEGKFAFQIGASTAVDIDASSDVSMPGATGSRAGLSPDSVSQGSPISGVNPNSLLGCELRATLAGYHSDLVDLSMRKPLDDPNVGTIVLHRIGNIEGKTTSFTTLAAPKSARKLYGKSLQLIQKGKLAQAEEDLTKATSEYPQYAVAWEQLGELHFKGGAVEQAQADFRRAIKADSHYVNPYERLGFISASKQNWEDAADTSKRGISLDPVEFPGLFWCNAVANYNLKRLADADKSVRALLKLDTRHYYPQAEKMMGELLIEQGKLQEAKTHLSAYLVLLPNAPDAGGVRQWMQRVDEASAKQPQPAPVRQ